METRRAVRSRITKMELDEARGSIREALTAFARAADTLTNAVERSGVILEEDIKASPAFERARKIMDDALHGVSIDMDLVNEGIDNASQILDG